MVWSNLQDNIFNEVVNGRGHMVVMARAGTGKTTTEIEAIKRIPKNLSVIAMAFNSDIKEEFKARCPKDRATINTTHGFGNYAILRAFGKVKLDNNKVSNYLRGVIAEDMPKRLEYINNVRKGVSLSKANLAISKEEIAEVCQRYELLSDFIFEEETNKYLGYVQMAMDYCLPKNGKLISYDFDDMIWLPIACNLPVRRYDWVLVDEAQDLNKAQIELCIRACNTKGRILACGDNRQAIYGWRGAALDAMDNFIDRLSAKVLPLSITYRCPKKVVAEVNHIVEDFSAHESAPEGIVDNVSDKEMIDKVGAGDFILSRTNAPLIKYCFQLLKMGRKAAIAGRDIGEALAMMVKKSGANTVPELQAWLEDWIDAERARLEKKNSDDIGKQMSIREDKKECIEAFMEGCATVGQVLIKIESLFSDDKNQMDQVLLSTTHKAKGLERNKVYMLRWTYGKRPGAEEDNLFYVAATRAKAELHYVSQGK